MLLVSRRLKRPPFPIPSRPQIPYRQGIELRKAQRDSEENADFNERERKTHSLEIHEQ